MIFSEQDFKRDFLDISAPESYKIKTRENLEKLKSLSKKVYLTTKSETQVENGATIVKVNKFMECKDSKTLMKHLLLSQRTALGNLKKYNEFLG